MGRINIPRLFLAGVAAGGFATLVDLAAYALGAYEPIAKAVGPSFEQNLAAAGAAVFFLQTFIGGPLALWLYAAIRPRFGAGPKTALIAATYIWAVLGPYGLTVLSLSKLLVLPLPMLGVMFVVMWPLCAAAMLLGGYLYQEADAPLGARAASA